ncbi:MAG: HlyU family transcriptional regulator [Pseudomonadota bacterium]
MASILSRLFGGSKDGADDTGSKKGKALEEAHGGFLIRSQPISAGGQWRLAGTIVKQDEGGELEREFQRADTFSARDEAEAAGIRKGKQIIDEQGTALFASGEPTGRV